MRTKTFLALSVCALALVGCAAGEPAEPTATVTVTASPEAETTASAEAVSSADDAEQAFLAEFELLSVPGVALETDDAVEYGKQACSYYEEGEVVPLDMVGETPEEQATGIIVGMAAKSELCPEFAN